MNVCTNVLQATRSAHVAETAGVVRTRALLVDNMLHLAPTAEDDCEGGNEAILLRRAREAASSCVKSNMYV